PLLAAIAQAGPGHRIYLSPAGAPLTQARVRELAKLPHLVLVCGRYEGIDQRIVELGIDEELSIGDYVLSGGELAAMALIDAVVRQLPGALGDGQSAAAESFAAGLLDFPQYTRPEEWSGEKIPEVLLSGHHELIRRWRLKQSLARTWQRRPDLIAGRDLTDEEKTLLEELRQEVGKN
ncbi:MAG TPA: tRNA (guanosine(37)-N1)-methyltransferase TrmD, partial [Usitatibacter sp.]